MAATKITRYDNEHDVHMRLGGTYLRYQGEAFYCEHTGGMNVGLYKMTDDGLRLAFNVDANDPDLDISSVPLGYCNTIRGPVYLAREAARRQKQGVSLTGIAGFHEHTRQWYRPIGHNIRIHHQEMRNTILGIYPEVDKILESKKPMAFQRRICLLPFEKGDKWKIKYMTNFAGILTEKTMSARLVNQHLGNSFLRAALEARGININEW